MCGAPSTDVVAKFDLPATGVPDLLDVPFPSDVYRDDVEAADLLLRAGANVDAANREGVTPIAMASVYGSAPIIDRLLKAGADAKQRGPNGETLLMYAARNGNPDAVKLLVAAGADVNAREKLRGTTALMWAIPSASITRFDFFAVAILDLEN